MIFKTKLQKEYDNIIDAIKKQLHQQNLNQYEKQITNTKLPKNDTNVIKTTWKQDKQQAHELICWCYDITAIQAIVDDNISNHKLYKDDKDGILHSTEANALKVKTISNTNLTSDNVYKINFNDIVEKIIDFNYQQDYLADNEPDKLMAIQREQIENMMYNPDPNYNPYSDYNALQQLLDYQEKLNKSYQEALAKFYQNHTDQPTNTALNDAFETRLDQIDAMTNLTTTEFEIVQKLEDSQKRSLLKLSSGSLIAGIKAVCIKYQRDLNNKNSKNTNKNNPNALYQLRKLEQLNTAKRVAKDVAHAKQLRLIRQFSQDKISPLSSKNSYQTTKKD